MVPPVPSPSEHDCDWRERSLALEAELEKVKGELETLRRHVFGQRSEKKRMPTPDNELKASGPTHDRKEAKARRRELREARESLPSRRVEHAVPRESLCCPKCNGSDFRPVGAGKETEVFEYIPGRFERQIHVQETLACACGEHIVTAEPVKRPLDRCQYGPGFIAHLITTKNADSVPLYRLEKQFQRAGVPVARSTMTDLYHGAAEKLAPLHARLLERIAKEPVVQADETVLKVQAEGKTRKAWLWTFLANSLVAYQFSQSRSGQTPSAILGASTGTLVVDGYTGYNAVCTPEARTRGGCWSHVRRKFFDALPTAPSAQAFLDLILELFRVEHDALAAGIRGTTDHLRLREKRSKPTLDAIRDLLAAETPLHLPQGPMGKALHYATEQWKELTHFLTDPAIPIHNNASERALRTAALGRKNFLFVGHDEAGQNTAVLYSLVASCEASGVNPQDYLADVLMRLDDHPAKLLDDLLPDRWRPLPPDPLSVSRPSQD